MARYLLGTDNGCTVAKAALFALDGRQLAVASRKVAQLTPQPGWFEMDMNRSWEATAEAIREVLQKSGVAPRDIAGVASAGHGNGLYLVDQQGRPVRNAISSTDGRAREYVARWLAAGVHRTVLPLTMQCLWAAQPNALLAWLRDHEPQTLKQAVWILMCKDYIRYRLTGRIQAELTDMSGTSLMNVGTGQYDDRVLQAFGLAELRHLLPPLVRSAEVCGQVTPEAAAQTGLAAGTPVAGGMFDIDACSLASGMVDETALTVVAGTWSNHLSIAPTPVVSEDIFMTSCYAMPGWYLMLEGSATSASNLEWFVTEFFPAERELARQQGGDVFSLVNDLVAATRPEDPPIVFLPFLYGSNVGPDAQSAFVGLTGWHRRGHVLRAIYEGIVFSHLYHLRRLLKFRPVPQRIRLTGGAARSRVWVQIFADAFQVPVEIPEGAELGALGAALCAGVASGCFKNFPEAVRAMVRYAHTQTPDPARRDLYETKFRRYHEVIAALGQVWKPPGQVASD
jgi:L-xylulokinase